MDELQPIETKHELLVPIFDCRLQLIVTSNIQASRKAQEYLFGPIGNEPIYDALCSRSGGHNFALFFEQSELSKGLTKNVVAHEIFHLTHRILEWVGCPFRSDNHEVFACLNGYLHTWVYSKIGNLITNERST